MDEDLKGDSLNFNKNNSFNYNNKNNYPFDKDCSLKSKDKDKCNLQQLDNNRFSMFFQE